MYSDYVRLRDEKGVLDSEVSKATGIPQSTFSDWKKGKSKPRLPKLQLLADYFNVDVKELSKSDIVYDMGQLMDALTKAEGKDFGIIDVRTQLLLRNEMLHRLLLAGGKVLENDPKVIEAMVYTLEKMGQ